MMRFSLTAPSHQVIAVGSREHCERVMVEMIRRDGLPRAGSYLLRVNWTADGRWGYKGPLTKVILAADAEGWFTLDGSGVPEAVAAPGQKLRLEDGDL